MSNSCSITVLGGAVLTLLLAGYFAQQYLPPPKPTVIGIDLGTTYSCIGAYEAVSGRVYVIPDIDGHFCIPSVIAFSGDDLLVGHKAVLQADHNPTNTLYDAKRFIGKQFTVDELNSEASRYPFKITLDERQMMQYVVNISNKWTTISPEYVGSLILKQLRETGERNLSVPLHRAVMAVPAEFDTQQRNYTKSAAQLAGFDVLRIINEPTAAALAYGLHQKPTARDVLVVDIGGGTLDVSLLDIQGGMFLTRAMAGNNHLGGQDFNERLRAYLSDEIAAERGGFELEDVEDIQSLRNAVEEAKLTLTYNDSAVIELNWRIPPSLTSRHAVRKFQHVVSRKLFEELNADLFQKILEPIGRVLDEAELTAADVDEIVLVGGSTRIPHIRQLISDYFGGRKPNVAIDPELAVVTGISVQAGIIGGMWPLTVSAIEVPTFARKIHYH